MRMDKAQAQLMRISNDASMTSRAHGLVILNPVHPVRGVPVAVSIPSYPAGITEADSPDEPIASIGANDPGSGRD